MTQKKTEILLVDDDPIILKVLTEYLHEAKYKTTTAENGEVAWKLLNEHPSRFSVMIVDRVMPILDGINLLYKIKMTPSLHHIPIIMLTNHAERQEVGVAVAAGVFDFLFKPIEQELLLLVVKRALDNCEMIS